MDSACSPLAWVAPPLNPGLTVYSVTPVETIVAGYDRALNDQSLNGELLECSLDRIHLLPVPPYSDGDVLKKTTSVYDGLFIALHGERSGLPEAVQ